MTRLSYCMESLRFELHKVWNHFGSGPTYLARLCSATPKRATRATTRPLPLPMMCRAGLNSQSQNGAGFDLLRSHLKHIADNLVGARNLTVLHCFFLKLAGTNPHLLREYSLFRANGRDNQDCIARSWALVLKVQGGGVTTTGNGSVQGTLSASDYLNSMTMFILPQMRNCTLPEYQ